ncbi:Uma2 family endonuclease [Thiofilum flexile]|uniref:Uma2 family endonuclease n=1 Tax=Thiofilum flexile TaxID=125627 RepID=UPI00036777B9|nr:Uma2 family endonuclease [Thiofilum flexile]
MLATKVAEDRITEQAYLAGEQLATVRHEYVAGKLYAMAGASRRHSTIAFNTAFQLRLAAQGSACEIHLADVKVYAEKSKAYYYPDVIVSCEAENHAYYLSQPCLIVEVTSKSTEWRDYTEKALAYQKLASLKAYLVVAQDKVQVTLYYRDAEGAWGVARFTELAQRITLPCPETILLVGDIYAGVEGIPLEDEGS